MQCEGKDIDVQSCTAVVDCTAEPDESKKLEKAVHDALNEIVRFVHRVRILPYNAFRRWCP